MGFLRVLRTLKRGLGRSPCLLMPSASPAGLMFIVDRCLKILKFSTITFPPLKAKSSPIDLDKCLSLQEHKIICVVYVLNRIQ